MLRHLVLSIRAANSRSAEDIMRSHKMSALSRIHSSSRPCVLVVLSAGDQAGLQPGSKKDSSGRQRVTMQLHVKTIKASSQIEKISHIVFLGFFCTAV